MRRPTTIGIISPDLGSIYFGSLFFGMYSVAHPCGVRLLAIQATPDQVAKKRLAWEQVDGWLVTVDTIGMRQLEPSHKPSVTVGGREADQPYTAVICDNYGGMRTAVRHIIEHGHQQIAFIGNLSQHDMRVRYDAYRDTLLDHGLTPRSIRCVGICCVRASRSKPHSCAHLIRRSKDRMRLARPYLVRRWEPSRISPGSSKCQCGGAVLVSGTTTALAIQPR